MLRSKDLSMTDYCYFMRNSTSKNVILSNLKVLVLAILYILECSKDFIRAVIFENSQKLMNLLILHIRSTGALY